jgi:hypothetical protein
MKTHFRVGGRRDGELRGRLGLLVRGGLVRLGSSSGLVRGSELGGALVPQALKVALAHVLRRARVCVRDRLALARNLRAQRVHGLFGSGEEVGGKERGVAHALLSTVTWSATAPSVLCIRGLKSALCRYERSSDRDAMSAAADARAEDGVDGRVHVLL